MPKMYVLRKICKEGADVICCISYWSVHQ